MAQSEIIRPDVTLDVIGPGGCIGLIALATDFNTEQDLRRIFPDDIEIFTNRVLNANPLTLQNLRNMADDISRAAAGILPGVELDAMIYGCTSGTVANGADKIEALIHKSCPGVAVTNPASAALAAFTHFSARRISILTPYIEEVNLEMSDFFEAQGIEVINIVGMGYDNDIDITRIPSQAIADIAAQLCDSTADLLFISCTAMRAAAVVETIEQALGKPVVTSNQALVWHCLKLIGYSGTVHGFGSLFATTG